MWELRQSLGFTDPLGIRDLVEPANVRSYILSSTQHTSALLPLATREPFGACQQQPNPNPHTWTVRALLQNLTAWIKDGVEPPPSARPTIAAGTLVAPYQVHFPSIPANTYGNVSLPAVKFLRLSNPLHVHDYGEDYRGESGASVSRAAKSARRSTAAGGAGRRRRQRLGGIRNVFLQVPMELIPAGTVQPGFYEGRFCTFRAALHPFAHQAGAAGRRRSGSSKALSVQGSLCGRNQEGGGRPRRRSLPAARGREPTGVASRARGGAARALTTVSGIIEHHVRACPAHPDWSGTVPS